MTMRTAERLFDALAPRPQARSLPWFQSCVVEPNELRPFNSRLYPHVGAPGGPCDMLDDSWVQEIWLQWGSRLGKTMFAQSATLFTAATNPGPMLFASASQKLAIEVTARTYRILGRCRPLRKQMQPEHRRKQDFIDLDECRVYVAWSKSVATLSDKGVKFGHANEIDKWDHVSTSTEADPLKLWDDRFKEYATHKKIKEGTPAVKGRSRIERGRLASTNCSFCVPCPQCGAFQSLTFGRGKGAGVRYDKLATGKSDKQLAYDTAYYECINGCRIESHERAGMMRGGVWVPEGCEVDPDGAKRAIEEWQSTDGIPWKGWGDAYWITGTPARNGRSAGYHLSSLYALAGITWGTIAAEFVEVKDRAGDLQNFVNQWLAETFQHAKRRQTWEKLAERIQSKVPHGIVPAGYHLLTCGIDKQEWGYVYTVEAWGPGRSSHTVAYGHYESLEELDDQELLCTFECVDSREPMPISLALLDSGYRPKGVGEFCRTRSTRVLPCKGSTTKLGTVYRFSQQGKHSAMPGQRLVLIDTDETQDWIDGQLYTLTADDSGSMTVYDAPHEAHQDFCEQLLNDAPVDSLDASNNLREKWIRIDRTIPNDYRDCRRYAFVAMWIVTRGAEIAARRRPAPLPAGIRMPDGRPYLVTER